MSDRLSPSAQPILITGGAGFIGSHLADALLAQGFAVRVLDDLSTGKRENLDPRVELIVGNVADEAALRGALHGCQGVVHLAAIASVQASVEDPVGTHRANFIGTLNLCEAMRQEGIQRVLFASSAAVYGQNGEGTAYATVIAESPTEIARLSVGDAVMRMDLADQKVLMFRNSTSGELNVVYRREDGHIGWIDPSATK